MRSMVANQEPIDVAEISHAIVILRGQRVILDRDLAVIYGVSTSRFNEQVKRNIARFPIDFMFRLTAREHQELMSQFATSKVGKGGHRKPPLAFTEHGAIQAANILKSTRAIQMGVHVVRAFIRLRELIASNAALELKLEELEQKYAQHDQSITAMLSAIRQLLHSPSPRRRSIGFTADIA
jgi:hypothetical protein